MGKDHVQPGTVRRRIDANNDRGKARGGEEEEKLCKAIELAGT